MADAEQTAKVDDLARNLIEARVAAAELGQTFIGYLIDMALAEARASGADVRPKRMRRNGLANRRHAAAS